MTIYDIIVIGADAAAYAGAAYAAARGKKTALVAERLFPSRFDSDLTPSIPNAVWRRLELETCGAAADELASRRTLLAEGKTIETAKTARQTSRLLKAHRPAAAKLWPDFQAEMESAAFQPAANMYAQAARRAGDVVSDYFEDADLQAHLLAHSLAGAGRGPKEIGSAIFVHEQAHPENWPVRLNNDKGGWRSVLTERCKHFGVEIIDDKIRSILSADKTARAVALANGDEVRGKTLFFPAGDTAARFGLMRCASDAALYARDTAIAVVRFRLSGKLEAHDEQRKSLTQIIDGQTDLQTARDDARAGKISEHLPVQYELLPGGDVLARSAFCPVQFQTEDGPRDWTGQDRQIVAGVIRKKLASRLSDLEEKIRRTETYIFSPRDMPPADCARVIVSPSAGGDIATAARLIDAMIES